MIVTKFVIPEFDADQIVREVVKVLEEDFIHPSDIAPKVSELKHQHSDLNNICEHIAKTLGYEEFDDELVLLKLKSLIKSNQREDYWHEQYKRLTDEFRSYTRKQSSTVDQSDEYQKLLKENLELRRENSQQFKALDDIARVVIDDYETGVVIWNELPERIKAIKDAPNDVKRSVLSEISHMVDEPDILKLLQVVEVLKKDVDYLKKATKTQAENNSALSRYFAEIRDVVQESWEIKMCFAELPERIKAIKKFESSSLIHLKELDKLNIDLLRQNGRLRKTLNEVAQSLGYDLKAIQEMDESDNYESIAKWASTVHGLTDYQNKYHKLLSRINLAIDKVYPDGEPQEVDLVDLEKKFSQLSNRVTHLEKKSNPFQ